MKERIAIALEGEEISQHFGHTSQFYIIELEAGKANHTMNLTLQDGDCHSIPTFLHQNQYLTGLPLPMSRWDSVFAIR